MSHTPGRFVWFEHLSNDIPKARAFYEKLFDWNAETMPMAGTDPYVMIHNGNAPVGGYAQAPAGSPPQWLRRGNPAPLSGARSSGSPLR